MKKLTILFIFLFIFSVVPSKAKVEADAIECPDYSNPSNLLNDPACWTSVSTVTGSCSWYHTFTEVGCSCPPHNGTTDYRRPLAATCNTGCINGSTFINYADGCGGTHCTNNPIYPSTWGQTWNQWSNVTKCYHIDAVTDWSDCNSGLQVAEAVNWTNISSTKVCANVPTSRTCCTTPTISLKVNNLPANPATVTQKDNFTLDWSFSNPGYEDMFSCTITPPSGIVNTLTSALQTVKPYSSLPPYSGSLTDAINILANNSTAATMYPYTLTCDPSVPSVACVGDSEVVNVQVNALPFKMTVTPDTGTYEIGATVPWKAEAEGGYPPYKGTWSGSVSRIDNPLLSGWFSTFPKRYGITGVKDVTFIGSDNDATTPDSSDTGQVTIQDSRVPQ